MDWNAVGLRWVDLNVKHSLGQDGQRINERTSLNPLDKARDSLVAHIGDMISEWGKVLSFIGNRLES